MTFSYDPTQINDGGLNQMRFDLGDCLVLEPEKSAYLSDEEICAALDGATFRRAKLRLVESLLHRFAYEVDTKIKEADWKLSQRVDEWQKIRKQLKDELDAEDAATAFGFVGTHNRPPIFRIGMHDWRRP